MGQYFEFKIGTHYALSITDWDKIKVVPEGKRHRVCHFDDISITNGIIDLYRLGKKYHFEFDNGTELYLLTNISKIQSETSDDPIEKEAEFIKVPAKKENETHENRIARFKSARCNRIFNYFSNHRVELTNVKRYCKIEGVQNIENIRYEIRRMMFYGDIYHIELNELADILNSFGFIIRKVG